LTLPRSHILCGVIHSLVQVQFVPADLARVWGYFATPRNLDGMTPPDLAFRIQGNPGPMHPGQMISYRIRLGPGIWTTWLTEITHVQEGSLFVDEQRIGPYKLWHHEHHFAPRPGGVEMTDRVTYAIGFGPVGELVHALWIRPKLERIFAFRRTRVKELFG
jgi:ligand-binding SRPBCC domain-containing protein